MKCLFHILQFFRGLTYLIIVHTNYILALLFRSLVPLLSSLTRISIRRHSSFGTRHSITPLSALSTGFEAIRHFPNVLEEIALTEQFFFEDLCLPECKLMECELMGCELSRLDSVLGSSAWPRLRKVCIRFDTDSRASFWVDSKPSVRDMETLICRVYFPILSSHERIFFNSNIRSENGPT